jgi:ABC-type transport system substrate-binding protein
MKKLLAVWLILMLLVPVFGLAEEGTAEIPETVPAEAETEETAEAEEEEVPELPRNLNYDYDELVVGSTMPMYGDFSFTMWGNAGSDVDVRKLIHGYNLAEWDSEESGFVLDPNVVTGQVVEEEVNGDHLYTLMIAGDLKYSDGTPITAWDYAFSFLLRMDPVIRDLGGNPEQLGYIVGYDNYISGAANFLSGIRVISPTQMSIRISADYLPFFYEVGLLNCYPYPISVIAPGTEIRDDGNGVYLSQPLSAEALQGTMLGENGYVSHPSIVTGAYKIVSFDGKEAVFELNEYYKGNSDGVKPVIPRIVFKTANQATMIEELGNAEYGLLNKITREEAIEAGTQLGADTGRYEESPYPRPGLSFIAFNAENPAVAEAEVRRAIAMCLDKAGLTEDYTGPYGLAADAFYGIGQWMYRLVTGTIDPPIPEDAKEAEIEEIEKDWDELAEKMENIEKLDFDPEAAAQILENAGWKLNANGIREKEIDGQTVTLELKLLHASSAPIGEYFQARFAEPLKQAGIALTIETNDNILPMYYGLAEREYDMAFLASNFDVLYDPAPMLEPASAMNTTGIQDAELYNLALSMKQTEPGEVLEYCQKWVAFLEKFTAAEPMIPVYSNVYYDFYPDVLQNYEIESNITWSEAIVPSFLSDPPEEPEEGEEEFVDE